ncbi:MAG: hypothetical protein ACRENB_09290 [Gemmatimonadales bacterium]
MTAAGVYRAGTAVFAVLTAIMLYFFLRLPWPAHTDTDFDIVGFLWLFRAIPKLAMGGATLFCGGMALTCFVRSLRS